MWVFRVLDGRGRPRSRASPRAWRRASRARSTSRSSRRRSNGSNATAARTRRADWGVETSRAAEASDSDRSRRRKMYFYDGDEDVAVVAGCARVGRLGTSRVVRVSAGRFSRARGVMGTRTRTWTPPGRTTSRTTACRSRRRPRPEPRAGFGERRGSRGPPAREGRRRRLEPTAVENATGARVRDFLARGRRRDRLPRLQRQVSLGETRAVGGARGCGWLASSESDLAAASSPCDRPEHGGRHLGASARASTTPRTGAATRTASSCTTPRRPAQRRPAGRPGGVPPRATRSPAASSPRDPTLPPRARHPPRPRALLRGSRRAGHLRRAAWFGLGCPFAVVEPPFRRSDRVLRRRRGVRDRSAVSHGSNPRARPRTGRSSRPCTARARRVRRPRGRRWVGRSPRDGFAGRRVGGSRAREDVGRIGGDDARTSRRHGAVASWNRR